MKKISNFVDDQIIRIAIAVGICALLSEFVWGKLQVMPACCAVMMDTQASAKFSFKSSINRVLATITAGICATLMTFAAEALNIPIVTILFAMIGVLLTITCCKLIKLPHMLTRIGAVYFVVLYFSPTPVPIQAYSFFRVISTIEAGIVVVLVALIWDFVAVHIFHKERKPAEPAWGNNK